MSEQGETNSQNSEEMYSYKSDNNNNINKNNINNNINNNDNNIQKFESAAIRRTINDINFEQNQNQRNINPSGKNFFSSGTIKEKDNYQNGSIPYRSSQISIIIPPESPLHWSFIFIYIILEVLLIILIPVLRFLI